MKRSLLAAGLLLLSVMAAGPTGAADRLYDRHDGDLILTDFAGKPYWEMQAMCAGFHRATAAYWTGRGMPDKARHERVSAAQATNRVVIQLRRDRNLQDRAAAIQLAAPSEQVGWRVTEKAIAKDGLDQDGQWAFWNNVCVKADKAWFKQ